MMKMVTYAIMNQSANPMKSRKQLTKPCGPIIVLKFVFSKKATKIDEIFTVDLTVKLMVKISSFFVAFLENMNFKNTQGAEVSTKINKTSGDIIIRKGFNCDVS